MKRIGIITTGGDCSGLNWAIRNITTGGIARGWTIVGIADGTDGLTGRVPAAINLTADAMPPEFARISGSILKNGERNSYKKWAAGDYGRAIKSGIKKLGLDALVLIGGNGSLSLAYSNPGIYSSVQLICIPKTIDLDVPLTDRTIGFDTAVNELAKYCDQLMLTARSHHRWFVVQAMGRGAGCLALNAGIAGGADAILIPEVKFRTENLIKHIKSLGRDYGIIVVSEGIKIRGHSGQPAEMIQRELARAGIPSSAEFPGHLQRAGDTVATDRILAARFANCALDAIENGETLVMATLDGDAVKTVSLGEFFAAGETMEDPNIKSVAVANRFVSSSDPLLKMAVNSDIYVGELKK
ncbi:MAG: 6-phosphofructokinase [Rickettsiales bacterium]|jgi:6-phosphofructokinase 1|nr:6-phosphofructokinase [Rickettsiales bacterium]